MLMMKLGGPGRSCPCSGRGHCCLFRVVSITCALDSINARCASKKTGNHEIPDEFRAQHGCAHHGSRWNSGITHTLIRNSPSIAISRIRSPCFWSCFFELMWRILHMRLSTGEFVFLLPRTFSPAIPRSQSKPQLLWHAARQGRVKGRVGQDVTQERRVAVHIGSAREGQGQTGSEGTGCGKRKTGASSAEDSSDGEPTRGRSVPARCGFEFFQ